MKKRHKKHENHERWLISYADFITLLFAFFVTMYAVARSNEGAYRVLSESIQAAFDDSTKTLMPVQFGNLVNSLPSSGETKDAVNPEMTRIGEDVGNELKGLVDTGEVLITEHPDWLEIQIESSLLFSSASSTLMSEGKSLIRKVFKKIEASNFPIRIEGYTDNLEISNDMYPSNWELSSARASAVARLLQEEGIEKSRLCVIGFSSNFPIDTNKKSTGRAKNRRIAIVLMREDKRIQNLYQNEFYDDSEEPVK